MNKLLLSINFVFVFLLSLSSWGQQQVFSRSEVSTGNWGDGQLPWFYQSDNNINGDPDNGNTTANLIRIGHNNNTTMTLNGRVYRAKELLFQAAATSNRTFNGENLEMRYQSGGSSKIINQSTGSHVFDNNIEIFDGVTEFNPVNGDLIFNANVINNGNFIDVFGDNVHTVIFVGDIQGTGGVALKQNSIIEIAGVMTYTGGTAIEDGVFRIMSGGDLSDATNVTISNGAELDLNDQSVTVRSVSETGNTNGGIISLGSGTLTVDGGYINDRFQNSISGSGSLVKNGSGLLSLYGSQSYTGSTTVNGGVLASGSQVSTSSLIINDGGRFDANTDNTFLLTASAAVNSGGELRFNEDQILDDLSISGILHVADGFILTINNTLTSNNATITGGGTVIINGIWTNSGGVTTIASGTDVVLTSTASSSAQYGNSTGSITGDVTIERFIPAKRAFRFLSAAVSGESIENAWQQDTHITGTGGATNGFDETTTDNPSMFTFNNSLVNQSAGAAWTAVTSTTATNLSAGTPYRLFVRGDRTVDLSNNEATASDVTLSAKGSLQTASFTAIVSQANENFSFIGNPYQAIVDLSQLTFGTGIVSNFAYYWDPTLAESGAFVTIDIAAGSSDVELPAMGSSNANQYLQPGQAVFFRNDDSFTDYTIAFEEADKATSQSPLSVFSTDESPITSPYINLRLYETTKFNMGAKEQDAIGFRFYTNGNNAIDNTDAYKLDNSAENLAIINSLDLLSIEERALPTLAHELQLFVNNYQHEDYTYRFDVQNFGDDIQPVLVDQYTQETFPLVEGIQTIQFTVDASISQSMNNQRFSIQFDNVNLSQTVFTKNDFSIYPNPAQDVLNINWNSIYSEETQVSIFNITGHKVAEFTQDSVLKTISLPIQNLDAGVYLLQTQNNEMNVTKKFIKR